MYGLRRVEVALPSRLLQSNVLRREVEVETGVIVAETEPHNLLPAPFASTVPALCAKTPRRESCGARAGRRNWGLGGGRGKGKTRLTRLTLQVGGLCLRFPSRCPLMPAPLSILELFQKESLMLSSRPHCLRTTAFISRSYWQTVNGGYRHRIVSDENRGVAKSISYTASR